jgi:hypothetical protein
VKPLIPFRNPKTCLPRHESGFSLVSVMVAAGIGGVVVMGLASALNMSNRAVQTSKANTDFNSLVSTIQSVLNNSTSCASALSNWTLNPTGTFPQSPSPPILRASGSSGIVIAQTGNFGGSLNITKLEFAAASTIVPNQQYMTTLRLEANKVVGAGGAVGRQSLSHDFNILVSLSAGNLIATCSGLSESIWQRNSADPTKIHYSSGNVGIGTNNPAVKLDVNGGIRPGGAITGTSCNGNPEGTFAYDMAAHAPVYCNNTGVWTAMGGSGASPSGTLCGAKQWEGPVISPDTTCQGFDPITSCPTGYSQKSIGIDTGNGARSFMTCVKN